MLRLAFLGCGWATRIHSRVVARLDHRVARVYASRDAARARAYATRFGGAASPWGYEGALADPAVDAAVIATPPATHLELTLHALRAGKHVIVEKPAFTRAADVAVVRRVACAANRRVLVAENYHYKPLRDALGDLLRRGVVGEPRFLQINAVRHQRTSGWRDDRAATGAGALLEGGIHWIHLLAGLGLSVETARGFEPSRNGRPDRSMLVVLEYGEGPVASLHYSWEVPAPLRGLRLSYLWGTEGTVTFETNGLFLSVRGRRWTFRTPGLRDLAGYRGMWRDFLGALREDRAPAMTLDLAERDLKLVEMIYASRD
jgi:predicted dehydrogenase